MKIGVLSDTHDRLPTFQRAVDLFKRLKVDAVIHAGDFVAPFAAKLLNAEAMAGTPVHAVYGNNDGERDGLKKTLPQIADGPMRFELGGKIIALAHFVEWFKPDDHAAADVLISGHNHEASIETRDVAGRPRLYLNPGECCGWVNGRCTVALLDLTGAAPAAELIEVHG